jgi:hypothetical protein
MKKHIKLFEEFEYPEKNDTVNILYDERSEGVKFASPSSPRRTPVIGETLTSDSNENRKIIGFTDKGGIQWINTKDGSRGVWSKEKFYEYIQQGRLKYDTELAAPPPPTTNLKGKLIK